jgi:type IV secretion system protein VirD4
LADIWAANGGIPLGYATDTSEGKPDLTGKKALRYVGDRHIVTTGPNGSGKTRRSVLVALEAIAGGYSVLLVDPKGVLCRMTEQLFKERGALVHKLNPYNVNNLGSDGHNPIAAMQVGEDFPDDAMNHAEAIIDIEGKEPHFPQGAQDIVSGLEMFVKLALPNGSYADVRNLLALPDDTFKELVWADQFEYQGQFIDSAIAKANAEGWHDEIRAKLARLGDIEAENRELHSVLSTALVQTRWIDSKPIKADLAKPAFDFAVMKEKPTIVYLILPVRRIGTHRKWLRLMIGDCVNALLRDTTKAVPVLLIIDEAYKIFKGGFPVVEDNMPLFREFGIKLWSLFQDMAQMQMLWGNPGFETFLGNAGIVQCFAPQDVVTAEHISKLTGQTTRQIISKSHAVEMPLGMPYSPSMSSTTNVGQIPLPLMLPQDLRNMDEGHTVLFSNKLKGVARVFCPWPGELEHMQGIMALDPSA